MDNQDLIKQMRQHDAENIRLAEKKEIELLNKRGVAGRLIDAILRVVVRQR